MKRPVIAKTEEEKAAYWSGFGAYRDGVDRDANPEADIDLEQCWFGGWIDARIEEAQVPGGKRLRGSRTFWFGVGLILLGVLTYVVELPAVVNNSDLMSLVTGATGFMVIILRLVSNQPIKAPKINVPGGR